MNDHEHTFQLNAGMETRYLAGSYNQETHTPRYEIEVILPTHAQHQIEINQFLIGTKGDRTWVWDIKNNSTWQAFIIIKKDGALVKPSEKQQNESVT